MATMAISKRDGSFLPTSWKKFFVSISKTTLRIWTQFVCFEKIFHSHISRAETDCWQFLNIKEFHQVVVSAPAQDRARVLGVGVVEFENHTRVVSLAALERIVHLDVYNTGIP